MGIEHYAFLTSMSAARNPHRPVSETPGRLRRITQGQCRREVKLHTAGYVEARRIDAQFAEPLRSCIKLTGDCIEAQ